MLASFSAIQTILLCLLPPIFCIYHLLTSTTFTSFSNSRQMPASFTANYFISFLHYTEITAIIVYCHFIYLIYLFIYHFTAIDFYWHHLLPVNWLFPSLYCQSIDCFLHFTASQLTVPFTLLPVNWLFPSLYCQSIDCFLHFTASQLTVSFTSLPVNWLFPSLYCQSIDCFLHFTAKYCYLPLLAPLTRLCRATEKSPFLQWLLCSLPRECLRLWCEALHGRPSHWLAMGGALPLHSILQSQLIELRQQISHCATEGESQQH